MSNAILVGHSMGGVLSVLVAGQQPERIAGVVNLDGALPLTASARAGFQELFARISVAGFRVLAARFLREIFFLPHELEPFGEKIISDMLSLPETLAVSLLSQFSTLDSEKALNASRVPMLFIGSSHPRFDEATLARVRPDVWIARVAVSGHFVQIFALPQIISMIDQFLNTGMTRERSCC